MTDRCPACGADELVWSILHTEEFDDGQAILCEGCGLQIGAADLEVAARVWRAAGGAVVFEYDTPEQKGETDV